MLHLVGGTFVLLDPSSCKAALSGLEEQGGLCAVPGWAQVPGASAGVCSARSDVSLIRREKVGVGSRLSVISAAVARFGSCGS